MPAARVPPISQVASKWARRAASAGEEYRLGVTGAGTRWVAATAAADANYKAGVAAASASGRFAKGVARAGAAKYERGATMKGPGRFSEGVGAGEPDYSAQMAPFLSAIGAVDLPARGPAGADGNYARVAAIGRALRQLKTSR
jgi:hypothetical protein